MYKVEIIGLIKKIIGKFPIHLLDAVVSKNPSVSHYVVFQTLLNILCSFLADYPEDLLALFKLKPKVLKETLQLRGEEAYQLVPLLHLNHLDKQKQKPPFDKLLDIAEQEIENSQFIPYVHKVSSLFIKAD
jgi:hypothetical protein